MATNNKYQRYQSENVILPYDKYPSFQQIEKIQSIDKYKAFTPYQGWDDERRAVYKARQNKQTKTFLSNYSDPTELNSFIDALTNREAVSKKFGNTWGTISTLSGTVSTLAWIGAAVAALIPGGQPVAAGLATTAAAAAAPAIPAAVDVLYEKGLKPITAGKPQEAGLNLLMNLGETMDYAANPIKGLILEGPEGFAKATGQASGGRVNYDFDTGFVPLDMLLEIVVDPENWLTLGGKMALKTPIKQQATKLATQDVTQINKFLEFAQFKDTVKITDKTKLQDDIIKLYAKEIDQLKDIPYKKVTTAQLEKRLVDSRARLQNGIYQAIRKQAPDLTAEQGYTLLKNIQPIGNTGRTVGNPILDAINIDVIKGISGMQHYLDRASTMMRKGAIFTSGYGLGLEAIKQIGKPITAWAGNRILAHLSKAKYLDRQTGRIDLLHYESAKTEFLNAKEYVEKLSKVTTPRDENSFYNMTINQLESDKQCIMQLFLKHAGKPIEQAAAIDTILAQLYGVKDLSQYVDILNQIDQANQGRFKSYIEYLNNVQRTIKMESLNKGLGQKTQKGKQLFNKIISKQDPKQQQQVLEKLVNSTNKPLDFNKQLYVLKTNNTNQNIIYFENPIIQSTMQKAADVEGLGAFIKNIQNDIHALENTANAEILAAAQVVQQTVQTYQNTITFANALGAIALPKITHISDVDFKRYIIDIIQGMSDRTTTELLDQFDEITMPELLYRLQAMCAGTKFNLQNYPELQFQLYQCVKDYISAQANNNIPRIDNAAMQNFTKSIEILTKQFPEYQEQLAEFSEACATIKQLMSENAFTNDIYSAIMGTGKDIFSIADPRQLSDLGLAVRTLDTKSILNVFQFPKDVTGGYPIIQAEHIGKAIAARTQQIYKYGWKFNEAETEYINLIYKKFYDQMISLKLIETDDSYLLSTLPTGNVMHYFKYTTDPILQYNQLIELGKACTSAHPRHALQRIFRAAFETREIQIGQKTFIVSGQKMLRSVLQPESLFKTNFAWDPIAPSRWAAKTQFKYDLINGITHYNNFANDIKQANKSFQDLSAVLTNTHQDRIWNNQQHRYIQAIAPCAEMLDNFEKEYTERFNTDLAEQTINELNEAVIKHPVLEKYKDTIDEIAQYWRGEKIYKQPNKWERISIGEDEFTKFYGRVKELNRGYVDIQRMEKTPELLKNFISNKTYKKWFEESPEIGSQFIDILNNANHILTNEDYALYQDFLKEFFEITKTDVDLDWYLIEQGPAYIIPWDFIPASIKEIEFKYYYDILGIDDPRLVYNQLQNMGCVIAGHGNADQITSVIFDTKNIDHSFKSILDTYHHESGHNVLARIFQDNTEARTQFVNNMQKRAEKLFGTPNIIAYKMRLAKLGYTGPLITEEIFTRGLGNQIVNELKYLNLDIDDTFVQKGLEFSKELTNELAAIAKENKLVPEFNDDTFLDFLKRKITFKDTLNTNTKIVSLWEPCKRQQTLTKAIHAATRDIAQTAIYRALNFTPDELIKELAFRGRYIIIPAKDMTDKRLQTSWKRLVNNPQFKNKVIFNINKELASYEIFLDPSQIVTFQGAGTYLNGELLTRTPYKKNFTEAARIDRELNGNNNLHIQDILNTWSDTIETFTGTPLRDTTGLPVNDEFIKNFFSTTDDGTPKFVSKELYDAMPKNTDGEIVFNLLRNPEVYQFNDSVLGTVTGQHELGLYNSNNILINYKNSLTSAQMATNPKNEFVHLCTASELSISSPNSIWKEFTDQELLEALQANSDKYMLTTLAEDKKYGIKIRTILPTSVEAIKHARELGAAILPQQVAKEMYNIVNHRLGSEGAGKLWSRLIYAYKSGALLRPGAAIRNYIDTNIKSALTLQNEFSTYENQARAILKEINDIQDFVQRRNADGIITDAAIRQYFGLEKNYPNLGKHLTYQSFMELRQDYFSLGIAGNIMSKTVPSEDWLWDSYRNITGKIINTMNSTEEVNRLAVYLKHLDSGLDYTSAISQLAKTHFDYSYKTKFEQLTELVFPFTTFMLRNYSYWVEMLDKHPWLLRNYINIMSPNWRFSDYTPEELARDRSVQSHIINGHFKIATLNNSIIYFKANPSVQNAIQMNSNPLNAIYERLAPPISTPIEMLQGRRTDLLNLIPLVGIAAQSLRTTTKTGTPLPSVIGVSKTSKRTNQKIKFSNPNLSGTGKFTDTTYRTPKYRNNIIYDAYATKGITKYRLNMYPIVDIAHEIKMRYSINVYNRIKNRVHKDVYQSIRNRIRTDSNMFR